MSSLGQYRSAELRRRGGVCQTVRIATKEVADGRRSLLEQVLSSPQVGIMGVGVVCPEANAPHLVKELASAESLLPVPKRWCFISKFCESLAKVTARTASSRSRSQMALSKPRTLRLMRLCDWGSDVLSMGPSARWLWKRRAFSAIINCSAQEYETSSTTKTDAVHCEKIEGGCLNNTTFPVQYSRVGLKLAGAEPSEGMAEARSAALWGHWVADADRGAGPTVTGG